MENSEPTNATRRRVLRTAASSVTVAIAGCSSTDGDAAGGSGDTFDPSETESADADSTSAGPKSTEETGATEKPESAEEPESTTESNRPVANAASGERYESIQTAIDEASAGDTLSIRAGTHDEGRIILVNKPLTISGEDGAVVTWDGGEGRYGDVPHGNEVVDQTIFLVRANDVTIENLVLDGQSHHKSEEGYSENVNETSYGISVMDGANSFSNITLKRVTVKNTILEGVHAFKVDGLHLEDVDAQVSTPQSSNVTRSS